jgi:hypothetical protein
LDCPPSCRACRPARRCPSRSHFVAKVDLKCLDRYPEHPSCAWTRGRSHRDCAHYRHENR